MTDDLHDLLADLVQPLPAVTGLPPQVLARGARRRRAKLVGASASVVAAVGAGVLLALPSPAATPRVVLGNDPSASPAPSPAAVAPTATSVPTPAPVTLVLEPDGLGYVAGAASVRHLTFSDADATSADALVTQALGPGTTTDLPDCGPGVRTVDHGGFSVYLQGTRFVGWSDRTRPVATADGVGLGSTLADLRRSFAAVTVTTGTVGPEWSTTGGLAGGLDGTGPTSRVTRIGAGTTCVFR